MSDLFIGRASASGHDNCLRLGLGFCDGGDDVVPAPARETLDMADEARTGCTAGIRHPRGTRRCRWRLLCSSSGGDLLVLLMLLLVLVLLLPLVTRSAQGPFVGCGSSASRPPRAGTG